METKLPPSPFKGTAKAIFVVMAARRTLGADEWFSLQDIVTALQSTTVKTDTPKAVASIKDSLRSMAFNGYLVSNKRKRDNQRWRFSTIMEWQERQEHVERPRQNLPRASQAVLHSVKQARLELRENNPAAFQDTTSAMSSAKVTVSASPRQDDKRHKMDMPSFAKYYEKERDKASLQRAIRALEAAKRSTLVLAAVQVVTIIAALVLALQ